MHRHQRYTAFIVHAVKVRISAIFCKNPSREASPHPRHTCMLELINSAIFSMRASASRCLLFLQHFLYPETSYARSNTSCTVNSVQPSFRRSYIPEKLVCLFIALLYPRVKHLHSALLPKWKFRCIPPPAQARPPLRSADRPFRRIDDISNCNRRRIRNDVKIGDHILISLRS